jgi:DNA replication protein DnaC
MLIHPIVNQLKQMKFIGMAEGLLEQLQDHSLSELSFEERLGLLVEREMCLRNNRLLQSRLRQAKLHFSDAHLEDIDYSDARKLDKKVIAHLATGEWVRQAQNLILSGATGTGKSWLACAFSHKACLLGFRAQYWRVTRLLEELDCAKSDGRYLNIIKALARIDLLILDDWGMMKLQGAQQQYLLDILDDRYQKRSTLTTSQLPPKSWYEQIHDKTFADAILDRLLGSAQIISLCGPSLRGKNRQPVDEKEPNAALDLN